MKKISICFFTAFILLVWGTTSVASEDDGYTYTVKAGDTLWQIARESGITVSDLKRMNNLDSDVIYVGDKLTLKSPTGVKEAAETSSSFMYQVKAGDTLWGIARNFNLSVESLKRCNNLTSDNIYIGDRLIIESCNGQTVSRAGSSIIVERVLERAAQYLGTPYVYGGQSPAGFDCSGFVRYIFNQFGYNLPRTASAQFNIGTAVDRADLLLGDLVFFCCNGGNIDHVGIYCGNNRFIHSSSPRSGGVIYSSLGESFYARSYAGARRIMH
ncbi:MAG: LysM peptidoglycan-binding domain-containing protein [Syntrophomonadaceae bacterium]|nr:LysM peptidoglycan-binding domain-containing protein [Syntrophomonadaceae bacterium]